MVIKNESPVICYPHITGPVQARQSGRIGALSHFVQPSPRGLKPAGFLYCERQVSRLIDQMPYSPLPGFPVVMGCGSQNTVTRSCRIFTCFPFHRTRVRPAPYASCISRYRVAYRKKKVNSPDNCFYPANHQFANRIILIHMI